MTGGIAQNVEPRRGSFRVNAADFGLSHLQREIGCVVESVGSGRFALSAGQTTIHARCDGEHQFSGMFQWLLDVLVSKTLTESSSSLLLLRSTGKGTVVLARIEQQSEHEWDALLSEHLPEPGLKEIFDSFTLSSGPEQECAIRESFLRYRSWVGQEPDWKSPCPINKRRLVAKVEPAELWFLRFPLGMYCHFELGEFCRYEAVQWIVSDRTVSQVERMSKDTEAALNDVGEFLAGAYLIVNTYEAHLERFPELGGATNLLLEVMSGFRDVQISSKRYSLRWTLNPNCLLMERILLSPDTRFVFANFESDGGAWELGDGKHSCWNKYPVGCPYEASTPEKSVSLDNLEGRLGHIGLLRVFHCSSVANPFSSAEPAASGTLARKLLLTGAWFVEGSVTKERYIDHICNLLRLLLGRADLRTILRMKARSGKCDLPSMISRANELLQRYGYERLTS